ncbi:hypothetical protein ACQAYK_01135 [Acidithiobacillus sp. AC3]
MSARKRTEQPDLLADITGLRKFGQTKQREPRDFPGSDNPRHKRILSALMHRYCTREEIDAISGASNGPEEIRQLRELGLELPCYKLGTYDRDGFWTWRGVYALTLRDKQQVIRASSCKGGAGNATQGKTSATKATKKGGNRHEK